MFNINKNERSNYHKCKLAVPIVLVASFKIEIPNIVSTEWADLSISTFSKGLNLFKLQITQNLFVRQK